MSASVSGVRQVNFANQKQNKTSFKGGMGVSVRYLGQAQRDIFEPRMVKHATSVLDEFKARMSRQGQLLAWVQVPENQLNKWGTERIFRAVEELKNASPAKHLTVLGIGGSKHPLEAAIGSSSLLGRRNIHFYSKIDNVSLTRLKEELGGKFKNSNYEVVSKSGTTYEVSDTFARINEGLVKEYMEEGNSAEMAQQLANRHFVAITDTNARKSALRRIANERGYVGSELCVHDDVGGRFSALDDHVLFALIYAGASKEYIERVLKGAVEMTKKALNSDMEQNIPMQRALFYVNALINGRRLSNQSVFADPLKGFMDWLVQMKHESLKDMDYSVMECPEGLHHSAEAIYESRHRGKFNLTLTLLNTQGIAGYRNPNEYIDAVTTSFSKHYPSTCIEILDVEGNGISPEAFGAYAQMKHFETVYQGMLRRKTIPSYRPTLLARFFNYLRNLINSKPQIFDDKLPEVIEPNVKIYKSDLEAKKLEPGNKE